MSTASLGPAAAQDALNALFGVTAFPALSAGITVALTAASADPAGPPAECAYSGYARQTITFTASTPGAVRNDTAVEFDLPAGLTVTGVSLLTPDYATLSDPLAWFDLAQPLTTAEALGFAIPANAIAIVGVN